MRGLQLSLGLSLATTGVKNVWFKGAEVGFIHPVTSAGQHCCIILCYLGQEACQQHIDISETLVKPCQPGIHQPDHAAHDTAADPPLVSLHRSTT